MLGLGLGLLTRAREVPRDGLAQRHVRRLRVLAEAVEQPPGRIRVEEGHWEPQHLHAAALVAFAVCGCLCLSLAGAGLTTEARCHQHGLKA